ncbi:hypothetical protein K2173_022710 [Erythroxylum novogranatense]|uniref:BHLH domain-containing protein n=1 Tax=Erythroxylum novogranatense TaxID=1862640 RepID=A0AAV8TQQ2_9ROSI|nr:hypothetical protein K2173_022710 [Erythroxylum novogranatense]
MASWNQERLPQNLKRQLALAVRSIQWSYAIFWSISSGQPGVLEWGDGYYNGDIRTRKTVQSIELNADQLSLQRSEQLRELYESLSAGEASSQARRPSASLSPEDLTDTEWYYLVCMSFMFNVGQGLPGRSLSNSQPIWLCNAHFADSKIFSRSLLAKSASIQTVVCFPFARGVVELGVTELVSEDPTLIRHVKTSFLEITCPITAKQSSTRSDRHELAFNACDQEILETKINIIEACQDLDLASPDNNSGNQHPDDSFMVDGFNGAASQVQSWQFIDDDLSNYVNSMNSSDCISQTILDPVKVIPVLNSEKVNNRSLQDVQDYNHKRLTLLDLQSDDLHYQSVLSSLLRTSHPLILGLHFLTCHKGSSFVGWKRTGSTDSMKHKVDTPQRLLKKIIFEVPFMHVDYMQFPDQKSIKVGVSKPEAEEFGVSNMLLERKRREKLNERFMVLKSIVPSVKKDDKVSILDDTIDYIQELERNIEELESCKEFKELERTTKKKPQDAAERTSDNYGGNTISNGKKPLFCKRKACDIDEVDNISKDGLADSINVFARDKEVLIEIKCPWREGILLEIMDAISHLHLDSYSVQSSTTDGILSLTVRSKHNGLSDASTTRIMQALQRFSWKC